MTRDGGNVTPQAEETTGCSYCGGGGWYVDHEDECYTDGCGCSGVQIQCGQCDGDGQVPVEPEVPRGY